MPYQITDQALEQASNFSRVPIVRGYRPARALS